MKICKGCEQFERRVKEWNGTHGVVDPVSDLNDMVKPHRHLISEGRMQDGAGGYLLSFQCLRCNRWWKVSACPLIGTLNIWLQPPKSRLSKYINSATRTVGAGKLTRYWFIFN